MALTPERHEDGALDLSSLLPQGRWSLSTISNAVFLVLAFFFVVYVAMPVLMPCVLALLFYFLLRPLHTALVRMRLNRMLAAAILLFGLVGVLGYGAATLAEPAASWFERLPSDLRQMESKVRDLMKPVEKLKSVAAQMDKITTMGDVDPAQVTVKQEPASGVLFRGVQQVGTYIVLTATLLLFMLGYWNVVEQKLEGSRDTLHFLSETSRQVSRYLATISIINICLGLCIALAMALLGMPNPVLWGVMACLLTYIPYLGALAGTLIVFGVSLLTFESRTHILIVPFIYYLCTLVEGGFITPIVLGRRFTINPIFIFIWLLLWGWMWGIPGALLAVPLLMTFKIFCDHIPSLRPVSRLLSL